MQVGVQGAAGAGFMQELLPVGAAASSTTCQRTVNAPLASPLRPRRPRCRRAGVQQLAASLRPEDITRGAFDRALHFWDADRPDLVAQYLLAVDALVRGLQAVRLAGGKRFQ